MEEWMEETKNGNMLEIRKRSVRNVFCQLFVIAALEHTSQHCSDNLTSDVLLYFFVQRSLTRKNVWSPSTRPWSCCRRLTWRRCDTSWLTSRGWNSVPRHELQVVKDSWVQLSEDIFLFNPLHVTGWPRTRRRTWCPVRTWALCSVRRWWGLPSWTPWRRWTTSDTRDLWWKASSPMKTCSSERRETDPSGEARMEDQIGKVAYKLCPPAIHDFK